MKEALAAWSGLFGFLGTFGYCAYYFISTYSWFLGVPCLIVYGLPLATLVMIVAMYLWPVVFAMGAALIVIIIASV